MCGVCAPAQCWCVWGADFVSLTDRTGEVTLAACGLCLVTLVAMFLVLACNIRHPYVRGVWRVGVRVYSVRWPPLPRGTLQCREEGPLGIQRVHSCWLLWAVRLSLFLAGNPHRVHVQHAELVCQRQCCTDHQVCPRPPPAPSCLSPTRCVANDSGTAAKTYAQTQQQNYPMQAKKHKLSSFKVIKWTCVVGAVEGGIQFASLIFAPVEPARSMCIVNTSTFGLLLMYAPFLVKVRCRPAPRAVT